MLDVWSVQIYSAYKLLNSKMVTKILCGNNVNIVVAMKLIAWNIFEGHFRAQNFSSPWSTILKFKSL